MKRRSFLIGATALGLAGLPRGARAAENPCDRRLYPLSGQVAKSGEDTLNGIRLAVRSSTASPRHRLPLAKTEGLPRLGGARIEIDRGGSPGLARDRGGEAERLIEQQKVAALIGAFHSSVAATSSQVSERLGFPISPASPRRPRSPSAASNTSSARRPTRHADPRLLPLPEAVRNKTDAKIERIAVVHENTLWGESFRDAVKNAIGQFPEFTDQ